MCDLVSNQMLGLIKKVNIRAEPEKCKEPVEGGTERMASLSCRADCGNDSVESMDGLQQSTGQEVRIINPTATGWDNKSK